MMVSVCADHRKMLFNTVEFKCGARSSDTVLCTCRMMRTTTTQQRAMAALLDSKRRPILKSLERYQATSGTSGTSVMALLLDKQARAKHMAPPIAGSQRD